jgi:hypothetical protein
MTEGVKKIIRYEALDGSEFDTEEAAVRHNRNNEMRDHLYLLIRAATARNIVSHSGLLNRGLSESNVTRRFDALYNAIKDIEKASLMDALILLLDGRFTSAAADALRRELEATTPSYNRCVVSESDGPEWKAGLKKAGKALSDEGDES